MKKKLISLITMSMLLLTGCRTASSSIPESADDRNTRIMEVYDAYKANGGTLDYNTWLASIKGEKGDKGDKGNTGDKGADGQSIITGKGIPSVEIGKDGDSYVDTNTWDYYIKKDGIWSLFGNIKGDKGDTGHSAFEEYKKFHPEYVGDENQWLNDLVNGRLADKRKFKTIFYLNGEVYKSSEVTDGDYLVLPE